MTIDNDVFTALIRAHFDNNIEVFDEPVYIAFRTQQSVRQAKDTITYHSTDGGLIAVDLDVNGQVLGIEIV